MVMIRSRPRRRCLAAELIAAGDQDDAVAQIGVVVQADPPRRRLELVLDALQLCLPAAEGVLRCGGVHSRVEPTCSKRRTTAASPGGPGLARLASSVDKLR